MILHGSNAYLKSTGFCCRNSFVLHGAGLQINIVQSTIKKTVHRTQWSNVTPYSKRDFNRVQVGTSTTELLSMVTLHQYIRLTNLLPYNKMYHSSQTRVKQFMKSLQTFICNQRSNTYHVKIHFWTSPCQ